MSLEMLKLENVSYKYCNSSFSLKNINIEINEGEIVSIIGKNGSGKSTLGNIIARINTKNKGNIYINNKNLNKENNINIRKNIGIVFQNPSNQILFNKVEDEISFTLKNMKYSESEIKKITVSSLKKVNMLKYKDNNPFDLSGGQKQKIAIASVISTNPKYIVFDESTSMLDSSSKKEIHKLLLDLKSKKCGIILITNSVEEILLSDRVIILDNGRIVNNTTIKEIINNDNVLKDNNIEIPFILKLIYLLEKRGIKLHNYNEKYLLKIMENIL